MARVIIIGGSGHVGTYLVPRLVEAGHEVVNVARGDRAPYLPHRTWDRVTTVRIDRDKAEAAGTFGAEIAALGGEVVIDMICFTEASAKALVEALRGRVQQFIHCGTIWVHGAQAAVPATEDQPMNTFGDYGTQKAAIERYLLAEARAGGFPATVFRPGHIVGPVWDVLNPAGHFNPAVFDRIAAGEELVLANFGLETVHHVHADDLAQMVMRMIANWGAAVGESFNAVSPQAVTLRGYAEAVFGWYGHAPRLAFLPFDAWKATVTEEEAQATWEHIIRSPCHSIAKAQRLLGYAPRYSSLQAVREKLFWKS